MGVGLGIGVVRSVERGVLAVQPPDVRQGGSELALLPRLRRFELRRRRRRPVGATHDQAVHAPEAARHEGEDVEGPAVVRSQPPLAVEDHRAAGRPWTSEAVDAHADLCLVDRSSGDHLPVPRPHERGDEDAAGPQHPPQLQQPGLPSVGELREHRHRQHDVEEAIGMRQGRLWPAEGGVARRAELPLHPGDRWGIDVAAVDLGSLGLGQQVAQQPARATAEIQDATAGRQAAGQEAEQIRLEMAAHAIEVARPLLARDAPVDVNRHVPRRHGRRGRIGHGASIAVDSTRAAIVRHGPPRRDPEYRDRVQRTTLAPAPDAVSGGGRPLPSNRPYVTGVEADLVRDALEQASTGGDGRCGARDRGAARGAARGEHPRAAHPVVHRRAGDGRDAHRRRQRQRGDRAVVHVRLDRQRVRPPGCHAGLRGHRPGDAHARPGGGRGGGHAGDRGRRSRPLCGRRVPDGRDRRHRPTARARRRGGCGALHRRLARRSSARHDRGAGHAQLPPHQERVLGRGRGAADQRAALDRAGRGAAGDGHQPCALHARRGRSLHVGRHRLVLLHERRDGGAAAGPARTAGRDHRGPAGDLGRLPRRLRGPRARRASAPAPLRRRHGPQRPHLLRAARGGRRGATRSSAGCARTEIGASSHYEPLHASPAGRRLGRVHGDMTHTESVAARLLRVPLWVGMTEDDVARVADRLERALRSAA